VSATNENNGEYVGYLPDYAEAGGSTAGAGDYSQTKPFGGLSGPEAADRLQGIIERGRSWPIWAADRIGGIDTGTYAQMGSYGQSLREIALWIAFRENDRSAIMELTNWERDRPLHIDPIAERISTAYSDLLYGESPDFYAANDSDQDQMDQMVTETALASELKRWTDICVSEGEVWWRAWTDLDASEWPLISGHSRINVIPLFVGRKIVAIAFVDNLLNQEMYIEGQVHVIFWRHIEIHTVGYVRNLLYKGSVGGLGDRYPLTSLPETSHLDEDWDHGLPVMLAGRVPNKLGRDFRLGVSEYQGVRDLMMDLNEARTIMAENARLVLKARMVVPANAIDAEGNFDAGNDVIVSESLDEEMAGKQGGPYAVLEYNFRADQLVQHKNELTLDIMARCGLAEQYVQESRGGGGQAFTGTALRTRLIPTIQAAQGKARNFDREVPKMLKSLALLSNLPPERGGCGQPWQDPEGPHVQQRSPLLPEDLNEKVQRHVMAVQGEVESIQTAVEDMHAGEWDDDRVELEVERIRSDRNSGPTFAEDLDDLEQQEQEAETERQSQLESMQIPNVPPGGPGSAVPDPKDVVGSAQPGASSNPPVDGQSPGRRPPQVKAGGPK
jgi:hypothetical protein